MQNRLISSLPIPLSYVLFLVILIEGFSSIAIEILAIRQLLPVAGGSVIVTSLIIGTFLLFLALGYKHGGEIEQNREARLRNNFLISALWAGIGLSYLFIDAFFSFIQFFLGPHLIYPLIAYLLIVLAPTIYLLGQTLPITMNIVKQDKTAGIIAGKALGLSTIGSFLGAIFTTLVLMHCFGVAWTLFIVFILLVLLALLLCERIKAALTLLIIAIAPTGLVFFINIVIENNKFTLTNAYANYQILNHSNSALANDQKILVINNVFSSYKDTNRNAFPYVQAMAKIIFDDLKLMHADILVLGAGGFTLSQNDAGQNNFVYVDIDDQLSKVLVPDFIAEIKDKLIIDDARHYLFSSSSKFDVIVVDVYTDYKAIPAHLLTREFMQIIKDHLKNKNSYVIFNILANPTFTDPYSKRINNTIMSVFGSCSISPIQYSNQLSNLIYACSNGTDPADRVIYTDNLNTSTTDSFNW